jgi:hypothetical protein
VSEFVVYDAGALVAADKNQKTFLARHDQLLRSGVRPVLPAPVLSQAWMPGGKNVQMNRVIKGCEVISFSEEHAREVGRLCRKAGTSDVVDGFVAYAALSHENVSVITSDVGDIRTLLSGEPRAGKIVIRKP